MLQQTPNLSRENDANWKIQQIFIRFPLQSKQNLQTSVQTLKNSMRCHGDGVTVPDLYKSPWFPWRLGEETRLVWNPGTIRLLTIIRLIICDGFIQSLVPELWYIRTEPADPVTPHRHRCRTTRTCRTPSPKNTCSFSWGWRKTQTYLKKRTRTRTRSRTVRVWPSSNLFSLTEHTCCPDARGRGLIQLASKQLAERDATSWTQTQSWLRTGSAEGLGWFHVNVS